jgi:hypothetical protein
LRIHAGGFRVAGLADSERRDRASQPPAKKVFTDQSLGAFGRVAAPAALQRQTDGAVAFVGFQRASSGRAAGLQGCVATITE